MLEDITNKQYSLKINIYICIDALSEYVAEIDYLYHINVTSWVTANECGHTV